MSESSFDKSKNSMINTISLLEAIEGEGGFWFDTSHEDIVLDGHFSLKNLIEIGNAAKLDLERREL